MHINYFWNVLYENEFFDDNTRGPEDNIISSDSVVNNKM